MMNKQQKKNYVEEMKKVFTSNEAVMIAHYQGLNVNELNKITKIALKDTKYKELEKFFTGPTAAAISSDPIMSAKILSKYAKSGSSLKIVAGYMDGKVLEAEDVAKIATLPTLDEARAKIIGILSTPAQKFLSILLAPGSKIAILAHEKSKKS